MGFSIIDQPFLDTPPISMETPILDIQNMYTIDSSYGYGPHWDDVRPRDLRLQGENSELTPMLGLP